MRNICRTGSCAASRRAGARLGGVVPAWRPAAVERGDRRRLSGRPAGPPLERRWALVRAAADCGVPAQITVSPCLPHSDVEAFGRRLLASGGRRIVVDTPV